MDGWEAVGCGSGVRPCSAWCEPVSIHSYLHVEPCNYQASSAGAKLFFPHPGPGYGIARLAAVDQWESRTGGGGGN